jgi:addiction module RelE/StbE family toxin
MQVKWLRLALADLEKAVAYIAQSNPDAAEKTAARIWEATQMLAHHPEIGRPGRVPNTRELFVPGTSYIVPYRVVGNAVQILRVLHTSRKWPNDFS